MVDVIDLLCWPDSVSDFIHHDFQSDSVYNGHPEARLERALNIVSNEGGYVSNIPAEARPGMMSHIVIRKIVGKKIELRMADHFRMKGIENTKAILSKSLTWPISTSAFKDSRDELEKKLELMALGSALPFRLTPKGKAGAKRKFKSGSYTAFALEYCIALNEVRTQRQVDSASSSDDINASDPTFSDSPCSRGEGRNENETPFAKHPFQTYANRWVEQARDLPPFPDSGIAPSEMEDPDLKAWHQAALSRAEAICSGKWDDYSWWPECVKKRAGVKASRLRSTKEAVSEKLMAGMKRLQPGDGSV